MNYSVNIKNIIERMPHELLDSGIDKFNNIRPYTNQEHGALDIVNLFPNTFYKQHRHNITDAVLMCISGQATAIIGEDKKEINFIPGIIIDVPKGTWHGFNTSLEGVIFTSFQNPGSIFINGTWDIEYRND